MLRPDHSGISNSSNPEKIGLRKSEWQRGSSMASALRQLCTDCGYVYDPADYGGISLVDRVDWECPGIEGPCGATPDKFDILPPETALEDDEEETPDGTDGGDVDTAVRSKVLEASRAERAVIDLARMYDDGELILQPDWQRDYVWSNKQASQLIESLFLRLPIPLIYLFQEEDGTISGSTAVNVVAVLCGTGARG